MKTAKRIKLAGLSTLLMACMLIGVWGCQPQTAENETAGTAQDAVESEGGNGAGKSQPGATKDAEETPETIQSTRTALVPEVATHEDGEQTQRTPSEYPELKMWYYPQEELDGSYAYNVQALDADNRGCNACHTNLAETVQHLGYPHVDLRNNYGIATTVDMCLDCHSYQPLALAEQYGFKEMIHNLHYKSSVDFKGSCMSCHAQYGDDASMQLFDDVKYDLLRGIVDVADVQGAFTFSQDETTELDDLWNFPWYSYDDDYMREENALGDVPLDQDMYDNWTISISGAVEQETTFHLKDLVDEGYGEDIVLTGICTMNPQGGPLLANLEMKGIPLARLFDEVGLDDSATGFTTLASDGGYGYTTSMDNFSDEHGGYLVYEIDGEPLSWENGYPVTYWVQGSGSAGQNTKELSDIVVLDTELDSHAIAVLGNPTEEGWNAFDAGEPVDGGGHFTNKPCVGIFDTREGLVVPVNEGYTFHGYADGFEQTIAAIEFSMDNGVTWTRYETPGTTSNNWVTWQFEYAPEQRGAYVMAVRAVTENGMTAADPVKIMINAKDA